jgi:hypothetical protein
VGGLGLGVCGPRECARWAPASQIAWGRRDSIWIMNADGSNKRIVTEAGGVPGAWAPGPFITSQCPAETTIELCAVREDGSALTTLLAGMEAGFPGWPPKRGG